MTAQALKATTARIRRPIREEACPVAAIMRETAACWRLVREENIDARVHRLPRGDQSEITERYVKHRLRRRIEGLQILASELQPKSLVGVAYQLLLAMNLATLDDEIDAAVDPQRTGATDHLEDSVDNVQNTIVSAYTALRMLIADPDLAEVERPHRLRKWRPNRTVTALLTSQ